MHAMVLHAVGPLSDPRSALRCEDVPPPVPRAGEVRLRVRACGVCHTELDEIEGRTPPSSLPRILGHQVIGVIDRVGPGVDTHQVGSRVGVAWIAGACQTCEWCASGRENLCARFEATGRDRDGGYAEWTVARSDFVYPIPDQLADAQAAPLLCAGAIGYRSLMMTGIRDGQRLGLTGFGASAHLVLALARRLYPASSIFVFARSDEERAFARQLGAVWAGDTDQRAPELVAAIIDTTPAWRPVVRALENLAPAGRVVINAIRKEDTDRSALMQIDYATHLWREKTIQTVANVTREDVRRCLELASGLALEPTVTEYPLEAANQALADLKHGGSRGARVLRVTSEPP